MTWDSLNYLALFNCKRGKKICLQWSKIVVFELLIPFTILLQKDKDVLFMVEISPVQQGKVKKKPNWQTHFLALFALFDPLDVDESQSIFQQGMLDTPTVPFHPRNPAKN